ncbi:radical SAM/SPASM domain-containing protein [Clostridium hydrogenum]|uniref:radical SAM/SPASM domain-containing protein n=1 Tax=Clostridium hydrogenum TaxID=2855764 RepID=UPI001F1E52A1|nr:radical SAM/SPASM domain-containing protein [Clostridium hydrogenum]
MFAKKYTRIRKENRTKLQEVIPLQTPFHIFVDPSSSCNFRCKFCFNRNKDKSDSKVMKFDLFVKIINDLKQFPNKLKVLRLYKDGEPLVNKRLPEMIAYAKQMNVAESIDFTTNGSLLCPEKNLELIESGVDAINISVEGLSAEKYLEVSGVKIDFDRYVENIRHLYKNRKNCRIHIKTTDVNIENEEERFYEIFGNICDEISIEKVVPIWPNVDITDVKSDFKTGLYNQKIKGVKVCPYIFYSMSINSDGSVSSCFIDWQHTNVIGDVRQNSVKEIWEGIAMKELRMSHLKMQKDKHNICSECKQLEFATIDNIDDYASELLDRVK